MDIEFKDILKRKQSYYSYAQAAYDFAVEEYATRKMINENKYILKIAKHDINEVAIALIENRIAELEAMINNG